MKKIKFLVLFFVLPFCFAATGHLEVTLTKKPARGFFAAQNQTNAASALVGQNTKIPGDTDVFVQIDHPSFAYGDQTQNELAFIGRGKNNLPGVYLFKNGNITKIADTQTDIPKGTAYFDQLMDTSYDAASGSVAFIGTGVFGQKGIYFFDGKALSKMVDQQDLIPLQEGKFFDFSDINLFRQMLVFRGTNEQGKSGIYLYSNAGIYKIVDISDKIEGNIIDDLHVEPNSFGYNQLTIRVDFDGGLTQDYLVMVNYVPY